MRLQKFLARAGVASRRGSEDLMTAGRVRVNGVVMTELGTKVDPAVDSVTVDGKPVSPCRAARLPRAEQARRRRHHDERPAGTDDGRRRSCPVKEHPGLFPVGRLDYETTGLLLFTTDGEIAHRLLHPSRHVEKVYRVLVDGRATEPELDRLREGVSLDDGLTAPARVQALRSSGGTTYCEIAIREGRKRQVRRMFSADRASRARAAPHPFRPGRARRPAAVRRGAHWTPQEVSALREAVGMTEEARLMALVVFTGGARSGKSSAAQSARSPEGLDGVVRHRRGVRHGR